MNDKDHQHLDLLGIFQYIFAGISALSAVSAPLQYYMFRKMLSGEFMPGAPDFKEPPEEVWFFLALILTIGFVISLAMAILSFFTARNLKRHRGRTLGMVTAVLECVLFPIGTILGISTLVVLNRDSVIALFEQSKAQPS